jgi:hypothetical protein
MQKAFIVLVPGKREVLVARLLAGQSLKLTVVCSAPTEHAASMIANALNSSPLSVHENTSGEPPR